MRDDDDKRSTKKRSTTTKLSSGFGGGDDDDGPTQLRHQSYVGRSARPGAYYREGPGGASAPAPLPSPEATESSASAEDLPSRNQDPEVLLEAEPVSNLVVDAVPMAATTELPMWAGQTAPKEEEPSPPLRLTRRTLAMLVVTFVSIVVVAAIVGGVVATIANRTKKDETRPTSKPSASPIMAVPTPAPTERVIIRPECKDEVATLVSCIESKGTSYAECSTCIQDHDSTPGSSTATCDFIEKDTCKAFAACLTECGYCSDELTSSISCQNFMCSPFTCTSSSSASPNPAPATPNAPYPSPNIATLPTSAPTFVCNNDLMTFAQCLNTNSADAQACADCFSAVANSITSQSSCNDITSLVCTYINSCTPLCGGTNCTSAFEAYERCIVGPSCFGTC